MNGYETSYQLRSVRRMPNTFPVRANLNSRLRVGTAVRGRDTVEPTPVRCKQIGTCNIHQRRAVLNHVAGPRRRVPAAHDASHSVVKSVTRWLLKTMALRLTTTDSNARSLTLAQRPSGTQCCSKIESRGAATRRTAGGGVDMDYNSRIPLWIFTICIPVET